MGERPLFWSNSTRFHSASKPLLHYLAGKQVSAS
jgi:hypothetical protein